MSACSESQSTIFPLPSSPHWEPTTTTLAMSCPSSAWPEIIPNQQRLAQAPALPELTEAAASGKAAQGQARPARGSRQSELTPSSGLVQGSKPNEAALEKRIARRYRGGSTSSPQIG